MQETQDKLSDLGVSIFNDQGELRSLQDILKDVENAYCKITQSKSSVPLLQIELQDETSVPKVYYKGEEVTKLIYVSMAWDTATDIPGGMSYTIECGDTSEGYLACERIERRIKAHV